jgi:hypothetical protein
MAINSKHTSPLTKKNILFQISMFGRNNLAWHTDLPVFT